MALGITKMTATVIEAAEEVAAASLEWASDTGGTVINAAAAEWFTVVNIQVAVTFQAGADEDCEVHIRKSVDGGTTEDTEQEGTYAMTIPYTAGTTIKKTFQVFDFDYLDVGLSNLDGQTVAWSAKYDGEKHTGLAT